MAMIGRVPGATVEFRPRAISIYMGKQTGGLVIGFDGAQSAAPKGADLEQSQTNYLLGNRPALWRTHIPNYAKAIYSGLYRGVDVVFYGNGTHLEHDFVVKPGADYRQIRMHFPSNSRIELERGGALTMDFAGASLRMEAPSIYQNVNGKKQQRHGAFRVQADGDVGFTVANYDPRFDLIIDPVLDFSTYLSPLGSNGVAIATDANGNSYVTGYGTLGYPVTSGAFAGCASCTTANVVTFISKLSADGSTLLYSTVLGSSSGAQPTGIAVDANGDAIVSGLSYALDFPTKYGQAILPQNNNTVGFLVSLAPDGSSLNYGTLLGSSPAATNASMTSATAVAVDSAGNAYVTGDTGDEFFVSSGALNQASSNPNGNYGNPNIFLAKFSSSGALVYSAVLGTANPINPGAGPIGASAIAVDTAGDAYVTGQAGSLWPISSGAYLSQIVGSAPYAYSAPFVMKVAPDAKSVIYSTYLDYAYSVSGIAVLPNGDVFVAGNQAGSTYPTTSNAYEPNSGKYQPFLTEVNADGSALVYSTMVCPSACTVNGMAIDPAGNIWLASQTSNFQLPLETPLQSVMPLGSTSYAGPVSLLSEFDPTGQTLVFQTFLGGLVPGYTSSVAVDPNSRVHVSGAAQYGMYTTAGVYAGSVPLPGRGFEFATYAYVAVVDPTIAAAGVCFSPNVELTLAASQFANYGTVTIESCGAEPLSITEVTTSSGDFSVPALDNTCLQTLPVGKSCTLSVGYTPSAPGTESATLNIASNAPVPAVLPLSGSSAFAIGPQPGANTTSTVTAGSTATYALMVSSAAGYSGNIGLTCYDLPAHASCTLAPATLAVTGGTPASFTLSISTQSNQTASLLHTGGLSAALAGFLFLVPFSSKRKRTVALICFGTLVLTAGISACGGGSSSGTAKVSPGTYTVQVAASDTLGNQAAHSITLIVQ